MPMKKSPTTKIPKKRPPDKDAEPEQKRAPIAPKRPRGYSGPIALALVGTLTAALIFATAALKANPREPRRAPCPCVCPKA